MKRWSPAGSRTSSKAHSEGPVDEIDNAGFAGVGGVVGGDDAGGEGLDLAGGGGIEDLQVGVACLGGLVSVLLSR